MPNSSEVERLSVEARALPEGERERFIARACAGRPELAKRVREAVREQSAVTEAPTEEPPVALECGGAGPRRNPDDEHDDAGFIAGYKLLERLGRGGFGVVYLAEQQHPVRRRVALKVIKAGMDSREVVARFQAERQALAMMDHPNIATVFDAGTTDRGRPYFVMEYVKGEPINRFCDRERLSLDDRIGLFIQVCEAVQHAHTKGIIHRDLKPGNLLVEYVDDRPVAKVIDFGVAKVLHQRLAEETVFTAHGQVIGTFEYMSPEQAEMTGLDIDTRSDVYSLGVVLYELLTGLLPFERASLLEGGIAGMQQTLREVEPPRPSARVTRPTTAETAATTLSTVAHHRRMDPRGLLRRLHGDLDWIVMRCLEKERARRYESPRQLAEDLQRHLDGEPVIAGPPTVSYRLSKFVGRHRVFVGAAAAVLLALLLGLTGTIIGFVRAEQRRVDAEIARDRLALQGVRLRLASGDIPGARRQLMQPYHPALSQEWRWAAWQHLRESRELESRDLTSHFPENVPVFVARTRGGWADILLDARLIVIHPTRPGADSSGRSLSASQARGAAGGSFAIDMRGWSRRAVPPAASSTWLPVRRLADDRSVAILRELAQAGEHGSGSYRLPRENVLGGRTIALIQGSIGPDDVIAHERFLWSVDAPPGGALTALDADPGAGLVAIAEGGAVSLFRVRGDTLELTETLPKRGDLITGLALDMERDRVLVVTGQWRYIALALDSNPDVRRIPVVDTPNHTTRSVAFDRSGARIATLSYYGALKLFDVETGELLASDLRHQAELYRTGDLLFVSDESIISGGQDGYLRLWNWTTGVEIRNIPCGLDPGRFVVDPAGNRLFTKISPAAKFGDPDYDFLREVSLATGETIASFGEETTDDAGRPVGETIYSLELSADGSTLYSARADLADRQRPGAHHALEVWDTATRTRRAVLRPEGWPRDLALSPDDTLLALATGQGTVEIWDTHTLRRVHVLETSPGGDHTNIVSTVDFDATGSLLAAGSHDDRITFWDPRSGTAVAELLVPTDEGYGIAGRLKELRFSPDGRLLAVGFGTELLLFDLRHHDEGIAGLEAERRTR